MKKVLVSLLAVAGMAVVANAQIEAGTTSLSFQVWNGSSWTNTVNVAPGGRVEYRVVVSYTGTSTSPVGLGSIRYQPTFSNADNSGASVDNNVAFRNNGTSGSAIAGSMLSDAEAQSGAALATYGRSTWGGIAMQSSTLNVLTQFRHGDGAAANGAPAGSWIRLAGNSVTTWPLATMSAAQATTANLNLIARGVVAGQASRINAVTGQVNTFYAGGTSNLVVFRGALNLSDSTAERTLTLSSAAGSQDRVGAANNADDNRFANWFTSDFGGSFRSGVVVSSASIVVPTPGALALVGLGGLVAARRRRA